ncbi:MAG: RNA polymerase sigma factor [Planctomycetota bacterium]
MTLASDAAIGPEDLRRLLVSHGPALALFAAQWTESPDDCVQEALIALARQTTPPREPLAWLFDVVRKRAMNQHRAAVRRRHHESAAGEWAASQRAGELDGRAARAAWFQCDPASPVGGNPVDGNPVGGNPEGGNPVGGNPVETGVIADALATLGTEIREVIVARIWGGLTFEQIGQLVGVSTSVAHRRFMAGLKTLRPLLLEVLP